MTYWKVSMTLFLPLNKMGRSHIGTRRQKKCCKNQKRKMLGHPLGQVFSMDNNSDSYLKYQQAIDTAQSTHFEDYYPRLSAWYEISAYPSSNGLSVYFRISQSGSKRSCSFST